MPSKPLLSGRTLALVTTSGGALGYARRWTGGMLHADRPWPGFAPVPGRSVPPRASVAERDAWTSSGEAWLAGAPRRFVVAATTGRIRVSIEGAPAFRLDVPAGRVDALDADAHDLSAVLAADVLLGAALALDLAAHDAFALDASAATLGAGALVFAGPRGSGRSTLARALAALPGGTAPVDSVAPIVALDDGFALHTQFPQWHASPAWSASPDLLPIRAIVVVQPGPLWRLEPLDRGAALRAFLAGAVASALFPPRIAEAQLAFGAALVRGVRWARLTLPDYSGRLDRLPDDAARELAPLA